MTETAHRGDSRGCRLGVALALLGLVALAFVARASPLYLVFPGDGSVVIALADASYHARRALYSFVNFPAVLWFDPYLNFPAGSPVPWPPGYDWALAASARLFGSTQPVFERVAAWAPAVLGALTVLPVAAAARALGGWGLALGAGAIFALLPVSALTSRVGNPDHHAAVALLGAALLALALWLVRSDTRGRRRLVLGVGWALVWVALLLTWSGSLLYVALANGLLGLVAVATGRGALLAVQAGSALFAAACAAPFVAASGTPLGGPFSAVTLSWFHVTALAAVAVVAGGVALLESWRPAAGAIARLARAALLGCALLAGLLALPQARSALEPAAGFLGKQDAWAGRSVEGRALFEGRRERSLVRGRRPSEAYGAFAYLLPFAAFAAWGAARERRVREPALVAAAWAMALGLLAVGEIRFGSDFAPSAALAFALLLREGHAWLARRWPRRGIALALPTVLVGAALLWVPLTDLYLPQAARSLLRLRGLVGHPAGGHGPLASLDVFADTVASLTPETAAYLDAEGRPEYGVLVEPGLGHVVKWRARRPTSADPFGPYLEAARLDQVDAFLAASAEPEALEIARALDARYVLTALHHAFGRSAFERRLHLDDGLAAEHGLAAEGQEVLHHFRLVSEGPPGGRPLYRVPDPRATGMAPYKLFEVVEGALLTVRTQPGTPVAAELTLRTPLGRRLRWSTTQLAGADGIARLRVPYPSDATAPVRAEGPWRLKLAEGERRVRVSEAQVREGRVVAVGSRPPAAQSR